MSNPLRVGYLTSSYARPSDTFIRNEVNQLRKLGVEVTTFSIRRPPIDGDAEADVHEHQAKTEYLLEAGAARILTKALAQAASHPVQFLHAARLACQTSAAGVRRHFLQCAYLVEALYLAARMRQRGIQLLHNHIGENSATVAMLAAEFSGIPFSQTIHGPYIFFAPQRWALGKKLEKAAFTACISDFCRSQCLMYAPEAAWPNLHVVRCSVQPEYAAMPADDRAPGKAHFVCIGRLCTEKGQLVLVEAAAKLRDAGLQFHISLVGDGARRAAIEQRIREKQLGGCVELLGWQSSARIRELLATSTALVIASFAEGLPIVALEALATRRPVIATNIAAMSEIVEHGRSGWLVPPGSAEALAAAMQSASQCGPEQLHEMGEAGRKQVLQRHDPVQQAKRLRELFESVIAGSN